MMLPATAIVVAQLPMITLNWCFAAHPATLSLELKAAHLSCSLYSRLSSKLLPSSVLCSQGTLNLSSLKGVLDAPVSAVKLSTPFLGLDGDKRCNDDGTTEQLHWEWERAIVTRPLV